MFVNINGTPKNYRANPGSMAMNMGLDNIDVIRILPPTPNGWLRFTRNWWGGYDPDTSPSATRPSGDGWRRAVISLQEGQNFNEEDVNIDLSTYTDMDFTDRIKH